MYTREDDPKLMTEKLVIVGTTVFRLMPKLPFHLFRVHCVKGEEHLDESNPLVTSLLVDKIEVIPSPIALKALIEGCKTTTLFMPATHRPILLTIESTQPFRLKLRFSGQYVT